MKKQLLDLATAIHTVKVARTLDYDIVQLSLNQIGTFRRKIKNMDSSQHDELLDKINTWAATPPIVTEGDILELRLNLR
ncbi:hypothetical protein HN014_03995 [Aquimarina sp. TRL1]|uniref:hypothetical protein n=1 Tax=Aquimarina sp. (strain TRL1) TaxID=2736252 RepID=UPI0015895B8E|nr:hypothetical protein [Aquimarina sp. TRL1]QKX04104.1 hypothetical protein HN014_03995 [Aquimarina sp. TRL1]